ncbi:MAG: hypothetical protein JEZ09_19855, partial [Salinivirgaceae bacterium]|nr:hypothetical protein [Salinivirgaceae bacterium]
LKSSEQLIINQVYVGLLKYHPKTLDVIPSLAKSWKSINNETKYIFDLNKNAFFHDDVCFDNNIGRNIVASDVKYSIEQILHFHKKSQHNISDQVKNISGVNAIIETDLSSKETNVSGIKTPNDSTIVFELLKPDPMFFHFLASTNSLVFPKEAFEKYAFKSTVGSGPFCFKYPEIKGKAITLSANQNYFGRSKRNETLPFIDSIITSFITSPPQELLLFERGDLDLILGINPTYISAFLENHIDKFQSNPPYYIMKQTVDDYNNIQYNFVRANVRKIEINSIGYFDFSEVYFKDPEIQEVNVLN